MPMMLFRTFTILLVALLTGLAFAHVLELPAKMQYDAAMYIALQKSLYVQWGPPNVGGVLEPAAIVATALMAFFGRNNKRGLWLPLGSLTALLIAFPVVFFVLVAPANAIFMSTTLLSIPVNWKELRANWELGHAIRFGLQFSALSMLVLLSALDAKDVADNQRNG
jgi:hypothetical protein